VKNTIGSGVVGAATSTPHVLQIPQDIKLTVTGIFMNTRSVKVIPIKEPDMPVTSEVKY